MYVINILLLYIIITRFCLVRFSQYGVVDDKTANGSYSRYNWPTIRKYITKFTKITTTEYSWNSFTRLGPIEIPYKHVNALLYYSVVDKERYHFFIPVFQTVW